MLLGPQNARIVAILPSSLNLKMSMMLMSTSEATRGGECVKSDGGVRGRYAYPYGRKVKGFAARGY